MSKTEIQLEAVRTIKTAEFESLHVTANVKEVIEWQNEEDREEQTDKVVEHLISDFRKAYGVVIDAVGVQRSLGTAKHEHPDGSVDKANVTTDDEVDLFGNS